MSSWNLIFTNLNQQSLIATFSDVHFMSAGNNFGGGIFWMPATTKKKTTIKFDNGIGSESKKCIKQLGWIYYNAARWARLRPLDETTLHDLQDSNPNYSALTMTGGFYTACSTSWSEYSIFGYIEYFLTENNVISPSYLIAWTALDYAQNSYTPLFKNNFQYFNNQTPLWYLWDSVWGIGFVGWEISGSDTLIDYLNGTGSINSAFALNPDLVSVSTWWSVWFGSGTAQDTMWRLLVQGNTILSNAVSIVEKIALLGNIEKRTVLLSSTDINSSTVINAAKKNSETLCRGAWYITAGTTIGNSSKKVLCYKNSPNLVIDLAASSTYKDKTIIVKKWNLTLKGNMNSTSPTLDIFIDEGNLYINPDTSSRISFNIQGFPATTGIVNEGEFLKGNFVINGLLLGGDPSNIDSIKRKLHLQGKFVSLNTPLSEPSQGRVTQVTDTLWTTDYNQRIGLETLLAWRCNLQWSGNENTAIWQSQSACGWDGKITTTPLVILDGNFPSQIIK